jgi:peptide/nickel transport system substrate-binding protein
MIYKRPLMPSLLLITGMILAACGGGADSGDTGTQAPEPTATLVEAPPSVDLNLDPANLEDENARTTAQYLYETLVREQDGAIVGALAESFTVSEDGLDYIFNLRGDVVFHDGSSLNADVVLLNFNRWFDKTDPNRGSGEYAAWAAAFNGFKDETKEDGKPKSQVDGIEKIDERGVIVHLNTPDPDFLKKMTDIAFAIGSPASFAGRDGGSGPYRAKSNDGTTLVLEPFVGYWDSAAIPGESMEIPAP